MAKQTFKIGDRVRATGSANLGKIGTVQRVFGAHLKHGEVAEVIFDDVGFREIRVRHFVAYRGIPTGPDLVTTPEQSAQHRAAIEAAITRGDAFRAFRAAERARFAATAVQATLAQVGAL